MTVLKSFSKLLIVLTLFIGAMAQAEVAVIVSAGNRNGSLDKDTIERVFLRTPASLPDGSQASPVDQRAGNAAREAFNDQVLGKSSSELKAYWSRLIFTGKRTPPKESGSDAEVVALVAKNPNLAGYVDAAAVAGSLNEEYKFQ